MTSNGSEWDGFLYHDETVHIELSGFVCDGPARAYITYTKTHNGYSSCTKCVDEGEWDGRIVFLNENATLRSNRSFRNRSHEDHHTGTSILENLPIDMVQSFPLEYMHLVCLGAMRKLLWAWVRGSYLSRLQGYQVDEISRYLTYVSGFITCEFSRKPRYNIHNLIHLRDDVRKFGPLDAFSAFPFENHLQTIKHLLRKHDKPLPQVIRRLLEIEKNSLQESNEEKNYFTTLKKRIMCVSCV